jgi:hypothetical protein
VTLHCTSKCFAQRFTSPHHTNKPHPAKHHHPHLTLKSQINPLPFKPTSNIKSSSPITHTNPQSCPPILPFSTPQSSASLRVRWRRRPKFATHSPRSCSVWRGLLLLRKGIFRVCTLRRVQSVRLTFVQLNAGFQEGILC